jgi:hypothetical protein
VIEELGFFHLVDLTTSVIILADNQDCFKNPDALRGHAIYSFCPVVSRPAQPFNLGKALLVR